MDRELTSMESATYYAYSFSYNMYNDMLLFMTLNIASSAEDLGTDDNLQTASSKAITDKMYEQILMSSEFKEIGVA